MRQRITSLMSNLCKEAKLDTPVLFLVFNRSDTASKVFEKMGARN